MALTNIHNPRLFQYYLDNCFKFPKDLRNDIIYCQRALKAHIKVHQMVLNVFETQEDSDPTQLNRIVEELESEIYEVNAEQHYLFLRLRRIIDEFSKTLNENNIPFDQKAMNALVARELVPLVADESTQIYPKTVQFRNTEEKLVEKYLVVQRENKTYEIIDSDDEEQSHVVLITDDDMAPGDDESATLPTDNFQSDGAAAAASKNLNGNNLTQMSLLKPMAQRMVGNAGNGADVSQFLQMSIVEEKGNNETQGPVADCNAISLIAAGEPSAAAPSASEAPTSTANSEVSITVKRCRLNLQLALSKAFNENKSAAKAAANLTATARVSAPPTDVTTTTAATSTAIVSTAKTAKRKRKSNSKTPSPPPSQTSVTSTATQAAEPRKTRVTRKTNANVVAATSTTTTSNKEIVEELNPSEDSNSAPCAKTWPFTIEEIMKRRVEQEDDAKKAFLHMVSLHTREQFEKLQQRHSKRTKRTVHSNEQSDYEYTKSPPPGEKKRKTQFLLSRQDKQKQEKEEKLNSKKDKRSNRRNAEKNAETAAPSRSTSSSPDEKRCCNECLKSGNGCLDECADCQGFYHQACHFEEDDDTPTSTARLGKLNKLNKLKLCPACKRRQIRLLREETQTFKKLHNTAQQLEKKLAKERDRNATLQKTSKKFKIEMQNLFNMVNAIKSDQENENDSYSE